MAQPYGTTKEGIENQFGVNHIGCVCPCLSHCPYSCAVSLISHFFFTNLLLPKLRLTVNAQPIVVNTSSSGHRMFPGNFDDANWQKRRYNVWIAYGSGKAANVIFAKALEKRGIKSVALHPGCMCTYFLTECPSHALPQMFREPTLRHIWVLDQCLLLSHEPHLSYCVGSGRADSNNVRRQLRRLRARFSSPLSTMPSLLARTCMTVKCTARTRVC